MFDWFKNKDKNPSNVVPFPEPKAVPYVEPTPKPAMVYYRLGLTDDNRVSLVMGYSEVTMNYDGVTNLIRQLECFRDQLYTEDEQ